ncbi:hypothetical protein NTGHW29_150069 [Candidatus Nitrotoga sp. HW29]|nr:hypothetical protein NTGHW29_150069 [Candidatus Nitrotoga sp. HW29]
MRTRVLFSIAIEDVKIVAERALTPKHNEQPAQSAKQLESC